MRSECVRCREALTVQLPLRVSEFAAMTRAFIRLHRRCAEQAALEEAAR